MTYIFGDGGCVKRFHSGGKYHPSGRSHEVDGILAWRVLMDRTTHSQQNRQLLYRVVQCLDCDGPMMAPDVYTGELPIAWPHADLVEEYNGCFARASSARKDARHYVPRRHHFQLLDTCWSIDPTLDHIIDIIVDCPEVSLCKNRQSIIMIRNVASLDGDDDEHSTHRTLAMRVSAGRWCRWVGWGSLGDGSLLVRVDCSRGVKGLCGGTLTLA